MAGAWHADNLGRSGNTRNAYCTAVTQIPRKTLFSYYLQCFFGGVTARGSMEAEANRAAVFYRPVYMKLSAESTIVCHSSWLTSKPALRAGRAMTTGTLPMIVILQLVFSGVDHSAVHQRSGEYVHGCDVPDAEPSTTGHWPYPRFAYLPCHFFLVWFYGLRPGC